MLSCVNKITYTPPPNNANWWNRKNSDLIFLKTTALISMNFRTYTISIMCYNIPKTEIKSVQLFLLCRINKITYMFPSCLYQCAMIRIYVYMLIYYVYYNSTECYVNLAFGCKCIHLRHEQFNQPVWRSMIDFL